MGIKLDYNKYNGLLREFKNSATRLILLDFDGTIIDFTPDSSSTAPSESLLNLLRGLAASRETHLVITTGRRKEEIERLIGHLPVDLIVEHGALIREKNAWKNLVNESTGWKKDAKPVIWRFIAECPGSFLEEKSCSLAWHYRNVDHETGLSKSRALIDNLDLIARRNNLKIMDGKKVVEMINKTINKGSATGYLLNKNNYGFILSIGDDITDEDMFRVLKEKNNAWTIKVGTGESAAKFMLPEIRDAVLLLETLLTEMELKNDLINS